MPKIAICGAGPAGLTLARLLQQANIESLQLAIFEKDESPTSRFYQGGTLDLHPKTGLAALRAAGLWEQFQKFARYEGEEMSFSDKNATVYIHTKDTANMNDKLARPEIDREKLKELLLESVNPELIHWGKKLSQVDADTGILKFADGSQEGPFDLVVGADGAWCKVRPILSPATPLYSGICGLEGNIDVKSAGTHWETVSKWAGRGSHFTFSDGQSLMVQRMGDDTIKFSAWLQKAEDWPAELLATTSGDETKVYEILLAEYSDWDISLKRVIQSVHRFRPWPLYELPVGHRWQHKKGYTLIGDAAHLMTPYAGEGVNAAMRDSLDLANAIIEALSTSNKSLDEAVASFEESMFPRTKSVQEDTMFSKVRMFDASAPVKYLADMMEMVGKETGYDIDQGWLRWVPIRKTAYTIFFIIGLIGSVRRRLRDVFISK